MKFRAIFPMTAVLVVTGFSGYFLALRFTSSYAIPIDRFNKVIPGMTKVEVHELCGRPHYIRRDTPERTTFYYGGWGRLKRCIMEVYFGADDRVSGKFHDD